MSSIYYAMELWNKILIENLVFFICGAANFCKKENKWSNNFSENTLLNMSCKFLYKKVRAVEWQPTYCKYHAKYLLQNIMQNISCRLFDLFWWWGCTLSRRILLAFATPISDVGWRPHRGVRILQIFARANMCRIHWDYCMVWLPSYL